MEMKGLNQPMGMGVGRPNVALGIRLSFLIVGLLSFPLFGQQLLDDFNRPAGSVVAGGWTEVETVAPTGAQINAQGQLQLGSTTQGRDYVVQDVSGFYETTYGSNTCLLTWAFCVRQSRPDPSGYALGNYGAAYVLGATTSNLNAGSNGYAIVFGNGGTTDPLRLVRFTNGVGGTQTNIISGTGIAADLGAAYYGVRVTFAPATGTWTLYMAGLTAGNFSTTNPTTIPTAVGSAVNTTYTGTDLPFTGALWNHATGAGESAVFDNIHIPQLCIPTVNYGITSNLAPENIGSVAVTMNIFPASITGGSIVLTMVNGPGAVYGVAGDYTVSGVGVTVLGALVTITVPPGATSASFTIDVNDDVLAEGNETIDFNITNTSGDLVLGTSLTYTQTILASDVLPQVNFTTTNITIIETGGGTVTFNLSISPPVPAGGGNITIAIANGPGITCGVGQDYQVTGFGCPPTRVIPVAAGATTASFQITYFDDGGAEPTEQVTFTVSAVTAGMSIGATNTAVFNLADNDSPPTVLNTGDIVVVGLNANNFGCPGGGTGEDFISFFCFQPIQFNTRIILTDNGFERCIANRWGNTEGTVEIRRTGPAIPAGQVITFRISNTSGAGNVIPLTPDGGWTCTSLNGGTTVNMNSGGDQIFFMQGGTWTTNTPDSHDAEYDGTVIYGFSTNPSFPWSANCGSSQRSNLPIGMNCFSMAPTGASDFNKYVGPLTIATQRDWIIRLDNTLNWSSPGSCAAYNATLPNWFTSPILPITPGTPTPGLWRGSTAPTGTDWFDCKNWDDAQVPVATTDVRIDDTANNNCVVGITAGGNAVCASLLQTNGGTARNLTVQNSSSLAIGGPLTIQRTTAGGAISTTVVGNSTLTATSLTLQAPAVNQAVFRNEVPGNTVSFSNDLNLNLGGLLDLQGAGVGGRVFIGGNYSNNGASEFTFDDNLGTLVFNGSGAQSITTAGFQEIMYDLTLDKPSGDLTLNNPVAVRNTLSLTNGRLNTSATSLLTMRVGSNWINANDGSFVNGPMEKIGLTDFTFPVGKGSVLRPCRVEGITGAGSNAFTAEYFPLSGWTWGLGREATIDHVSDCEYWTIDQSSGAPNATVELTWRAPMSCGVDALAELVVARWDDSGAIWRDRGNGGTTGTFLNGTVQTAAQQSLFNVGTTPWTLASISANNPLPITLVHFTAKPEGSMVRLEWMTASETDNAYFTVERSVDGLHFEHVLDVPGAINSLVPLSYSELDLLPYSGISYYRLRQTDTDGTSTVSPMVAVNFADGASRPLVIYGDGSTVSAVHGFPVGSRFALMDMMGRVIAEGSTTVEGRTEINGLALARGAYVLRLINGEHAESERFVY